MVNTHVGEVPTVTFTGEVRMVVQLKNRVPPAGRGVVGYDTENMSPPKATTGHSPDTHGRLSGATERDQ